MKKYYLPIFTVLITVLSCQKKKETTTEVAIVATNFVDPFIGTAGHGHTYPGASVPFGMLQVSPDNGISKWDWCSGYHYTDSITIGFSHLHLSGTGIGDLADIRFMPINKRVNLAQDFKNRDQIPYKSKYSHDKESAKPGYYSVFLEDHGVNAEFTTDKRTAFHKYTYQKGEQQSVVIDLGYAINWDLATDTHLKIVDKHTISGYRHSKGWANNQKLFFVAKFSKEITSHELVKDSTYINDTAQVKGEKTSAQLFFDALDSDELNVKVGVSSVSEANALLNIAEYKEKFDFEKVKNKADEDWNNALSKIRVETSNDSLKTIFYTALYHAQVAPVTFSDSNGQFRLENDSIVTAKDYTAYSTLSLWDTFRAEHPLLTILDTEKVSDIINSMLAYYEVKKILPVWTLYGNETNTMTGYHAIPVIAEAYAKGIKGFDIEKAYAAMKTTMMQDERGLKPYKEFGYIPFDALDESVTITLELAYDDWCVAQVAKGLGKMDDYNYFIKRSESYKPLFDKETGFMRGKSADGKQWHEPFDPKFSAHRVHADYTEGNAWQHSWFVLHDVPSLVEMHGGNDKFNQKLEQLFSESSEITGENVSVDISGLIGQYAHGNEPSHHIAYMFNFSNQPWRTQYWVREILRTQYSTQPDGLSGNEDCGQMSAWYVFSSMGLYPYSPASGDYQIGSPIFEKSVINISDKIDFTIIADDASEENIYIQSATLNGEEFNKTVLTHATLQKGGILHFKMGNAPNKNWGIQK